MNDAVTLTINPRDRATLSTTIEALVNLLDELEPDPDLEDSGDDEPSLGWTDRGPGPACNDNTDRELDDTDYETTATERHGMGFVASAPDDSEDGNDTEPNGDEVDFDGGEGDWPGVIWGGQGA